MAAEMNDNSHLLWRMLFFISAAWLMADFIEAGSANCKNADLSDLNNQMKRFSQCFLEMLPHGNRTEINALAWSLQQVLDLLREVQRKGEELTFCWEDSSFLPEGESMLSVPDREILWASLMLGLNQNVSSNPFQLFQTPLSCSLLADKMRIIRSEVEAAGKIHDYGPAPPRIQEFMSTLELEGVISSSGRHTYTSADQPDCKTFMPKNCSFPEAPINGGLVCVSIDSVLYCKPMCNQGYDFGFLRRSRVYETCGASTGYSWTTQLVGGNRLAVCISSSVAVSGVKSAYFPSHMSCQQTIANATAEREQIEIFLRELAETETDMSQKREMAFNCILCGN